MFYLQFRECGTNMQQLESNENSLLNKNSRERLLITIEF